MIGLASPSQRVPINYTVTDAIETYPKSSVVAGTTMTFDTSFPEVINITSWPLTSPETIALYGTYFWLFDNVNGCVSYGRWNLVGTTLSFYHIGHFPNFTTILASGEAYAIADRDVKNFDQCSVKAQSVGVTVNGTPLSTIGSIVTIEGLGNANYVAIINCSNSATADVSNMKFIN